MNEVVDMTGELSAGLSFAGEFSVGPGHGARAIRTRASLRAMWPAEFLDGGKVAYFGKAEGEREKGGYPKGFHRWTMERRNAWFAGFNVGYIYCRCRYQPAWQLWKRHRRNILKGSPDSGLDKRQPLFHFRSHGSRGVASRRSSPLKERFSRLTNGCALGTRCRLSPTGDVPSHTPGATRLLPHRQGRKFGAYPICNRLSAVLMVVNSVTH